ncbi:unnamed protein product [Ilex paraguariensis]|uniref:Methyltransferase type 11 domain-containing protein n=1 Tax=Ilex paraguariensis TaxID=185542 RepID=A0ABC8U0G7_9AQUA
MFTVFLRRDTGYASVSTLSLHSDYRFDQQRKIKLQAFKNQAFCSAQCLRNEVFLEAFSPPELFVVLRSNDKRQIHRNLLLLRTQSRNGESRKRLDTDLRYLRGGGVARFAAGFTGSVTALSAVCLFFAAANIFYSSVILRWDMAQRMVSSVNDWSTVKHALDLGCGRGILLNAVALQLKKAGSSGRVVGLDPTRMKKVSTLSTLRTAGIEGVQEYVTCREGDPRTLPFGDNSFDVVVSAAFVHTVGKEFGQKSAAAAAERMRVLGEVVRVLKPSGVGVVWDLVHAGICAAIA